MERDEWEDHKDEMKRLYVRQEKFQKEVMSILQRRRRFHKMYLSDLSE